MSKTMKNKAASMALFATMMAVGTLPLAAHAPSDLFLENQNGTVAVSQNTNHDTNVAEIELVGTKYSTDKTEE